MRDERDGVSLGSYHGPVDSRRGFDRQQFEHLPAAGFEQVYQPAPDPPTGG